MPFQQQQSNFGGDAMVRINPSAYLHNAIVNAMSSLQTGLVSGQKDQGFILLILNVDQLEKVAMAKEIISENDDEYKKKILDYGRDNNLDKSNLMDQARLSNYKLSLLLAKIFATLPRSTVYKLDMKTMEPIKENTPESPIEA